MKKTVITLVFLTLFSGLSFASFQVKKKANDVTANPVENVKEDLQSDSETVIDEKLSDFSNESNSPVIESIDTNSDKNSSGDEYYIAIALAVISLLVFPFGLHNWYLGRKRQALIQTLLTFPGIILVIPFIISWVWQLIDLLTLITEGSL